MRGRKPKPTWLRIVGGKAGHRPLNMNEPKPKGALKDAPAWMSESQKAGWDYAIEHAPPGLLTKLDRSVLAVWVVAEDTHRSASQQVQAVGLLAKTRNGEVMQNPFLPIQNKQAMIMLRAAAELGFTPSARARISVCEDYAANRFSEFSEEA